MISALINNDEELSSLVFAWLQGACKFTIRNLAKDHFTFCPYHPHKLFDFVKMSNRLIKCRVEDCGRVICQFCNSWHSPELVCDENKTGDIMTWKKKCPKMSGSYIQRRWL